MIAVKLEGRLGNQLFQYAFIYTAAKKLNTGFYIDKSVIPFLLPQYFNIKNDFLYPIDKWFFSINGFKNLFDFHLKKFFYKQLNTLYFGNKKINVINTDQPAIALQQIQNGCLYEGFFQSEKYFENCKDELRRLFTIKKQYTDIFNEFASTRSSSSKKIVIHVRAGDYIDLDMALPIVYYKKALANIEVEDAELIFISDDPLLIEREFGYIKHKYISNNTEIIDLQLLMNADVCILSNSSFSWWGAWLNNKAGKIVYAPKNWIGFNKGEEYPVGIGENLGFNWVSI